MSGQGKGSRKNGAPEKDVKETAQTPQEAPADDGAKNTGEASKRLLEAEERVLAAEARVDDSAKRIAELEDQMKRIAAEYDNHRKRSQRENEGAFTNGVCFSAEELLPVLDTLDAAANAPSSDEEYKKGVLMTLAKCEEVFAKLGITEIEALHQPFDPEMHNAVMQQPAEGAASGTVTQVMSKGYKLGERIIRHAMVAVAP